MKLALKLGMLFVLGASLSSGAETTLNLRVLTFNVKGLPWALTRHADRFEQTAHFLSKQLSTAQAADVVFLQEVFTPDARKIAKKSNYPFYVFGPQRSDCKGIKNCPSRAVLNSGLLVMSRYPFRVVDQMVFGAGACTFDDCLINKGVLLIALEVPGIAREIYLATTHMNSNSFQRFWWVSPKRVVEARTKQIDMTYEFLKSRFVLDSPLIFAGDFNLKPSMGFPDYSHFMEKLRMLDAGDWCDAHPACEIPADQDIGKIYFDSVDHHFFNAGEDFRITPLRAERTFRRLDSEREVFDRDAYQVDFEIVL